MKSALAIVILIGAVLCFVFPHLLPIVAGFAGAIILLMLLPVIIPMIGTVGVIILVLAFVVGAVEGCGHLLMG